MPPIIVAIPRRFEKSLLKLLFVSFFVSLFLPLASAQERAGSDPLSRDDSVAQAQATMASLFSSGSKMPVPPSIEGTLALPSFDSSGMEIDENIVGEIPDGEQDL